MMFSRKEAFLQDFLMYSIISLKMFAGHIKVPRGPHVARGPDIAQACPTPTGNKNIAINPISLVTTIKLNLNHNNNNNNNNSNNCRTRIKILLL